MNLNPTAVIALLIGMVLVYSGVKNKYPQDVIREALGKPALRGSIGESLGKAAGNAAAQKAQQLQQPTPTVNTPGVTIVNV